MDTRRLRAGHQVLFRVADRWHRFSVAEPGDLFVVGDIVPLDEPGARPLRTRVYRRRSFRVGRPQLLHVIEKGNGGFLETPAVTGLEWLSSA